MFCFKFNNLILTTKFKKFKIDNLIQNKLNTCINFQKTRTRDFVILKNFKKKEPESGLLLWKCFKKTGTWGSVISNIKRKKELEELEVINQIKEPHNNGTYISCVHDIKDVVTHRLFCLI